MLRLKRPSAAFLGCLAVLLGAAASGADDDKPVAEAEKVLTAKGLTRHDRRFLLDETSALDKHREARSALDDHQRATKKQIDLANQSMERFMLEQNKESLRQRIDSAQARLNGGFRGSGAVGRAVNQMKAPVRAQQAQDRAAMKDLDAQIKTAKSKAVKPDEAKLIQSEAERTAQVFQERLRDLDESVAPLVAEYHKLALDKSVTDALARLRKSTPLNYKLGPSDELLAASKLVKDWRPKSVPKAKTKTKGKSKSGGEAKSF